MNVLGGACLSRRGPLLCFLFTLIRQFVCDVESQSGCRSGEYTTSGECCELCHPGFGVTSPCLDDNTKCDRCWDGMTFSSGWSHTEPCRTCTMCQRPMHMRVPCTEADDTICECEDGFFSAPRNGGCIPCNECKPGMGVGMVCTPDSNTLCEACPIGFFSDVISNREPCLPCTLCLGDQDILQDCTPTSDSICFNKDPPPFDLFPPYEFPENDHHGEEVDRPDDFEPLPGLPPLEDWTDFIPTEQDTLGKAMFPDLPSWATVTSGAPHMEEAASMETNSTMPGFGPSSRDIIPVYCSIMAAVVVGLVAYVVFKRWHSCKNVEGSKARAEYSVTPTAVEKQHHGSGESVEPQAGGEATAIPIDGKEANDCQWTFSALAPQTQEEVERLLSTGKEENGGENHAWRNLAVALGYTTEEVEELATSERPAQTLLDGWSKRDGASKEHLFSTLSDLGWDDVIGQMQAIITPEAVV